MQFLKILKQELYERRKAVVAVFSIALLMRIVALVLIINLDAGHGSVINTTLDPNGTSGEYIQMALNIINHNTISISTEIPPTPNSARTPLHAFYLLPFIYFELPYWTAALIQDFIISAFLAIFFLSAKNFFGKKTALAATIFFAVEPASVFISNDAVITETLMTPFFMGAFLAYLHFIRTPKRRVFYFAAILLAVASLMRPIPFYFIIFFPFIGVLSRIPAKKIAVYSVTAAVIFFIILSPWLIRNKIVLNTWQISSIQDYNLYMRVAANFCFWSEGACGKEFVSSYDTLYKEHDYDIYHRHNPEKYRELGMRYILSNPLKFFVFYVSKMPDFFLRNNYADIIQMFSQRSIYERANIRTTSSLFDPIALFTLSGKLIGASLLGLFIASFALLFTSRPDKRYLILCMLFILYTMLVSTPAGFVRYRLPILLPLAILSFETIYFFWGRFFEKEKRPLAD